MALGILTVTPSESVDPDTGEVTEQECLLGDISTLSLKLHLRLEPLEKLDPKMPDFVVMGSKPGGHFADVGSAFMNTVSKGFNVGKPCLNVYFKDPEVARHVTEAVGWPERGGGFSLHRSDPKKPDTRE